MDAVPAVTTVPAVTAVPAVTTADAVSTVDAVDTVPTADTVPTVDAVTNEVTNHARRDLSCLHPIHHHHVGWRDRDGHDTKSFSAL